MPITAVNNVTMDNITSIGNASSIPEILINVNNIVYGGWLIFILLCTAWIIMFRVMNKNEDKPLSSLMYSGAIITVVSLFFRVVYMYKNGVWVGLLTDFQLWIFPLITSLIATYIKHSIND